MQYAAEYIGSNYGEFAKDHRVLVEANARCAEAFGFEQLSCISDPYRETAGFGGDITYVPDGVPRCSAPLGAADEPNLAALPVARPEPLEAARMRDRIEAVRLYRERFGETYSILGWIEGPAAEAADLREPGNFLIDLLEEPGFAAELMDRCVEVGTRFARAQIDAGADTIGIGDAIASQVSPETYASLIQPREKRLVEAIHAAGARVRLHICGKITHLLAGIAGLDVDIVDCDHAVDLAGARRALGARVVLSGNLDPVAAVRHGTPESIREAVAACYAAAGNPWMVNAGCEIPPGTPEANLRALCEPVAWAR
jgi:MtaA/CmuA family methyltransferase